jgi:hypothetical protein
MFWVGSGLVLVWSGLVQFGLFFIGRVNELVCWLGFGPIVALKENCCEGIIFKASFMIGDMVYDEVG